MSEEPEATVVRFPVLTECYACGKESNEAHSTINDKQWCRRCVAIRQCVTIPSPELFTLSKAELIRELWSWQAAALYRDMVIFQLAAYVSDEQWTAALAATSEEAKADNTAFWSDERWPVKD